VEGGWLNWMALEVFSNLGDSILITAMGKTNRKCYIKRFLIFRI